MPNTTLEKPSAARRGGIDARDLGRTALAKRPASVEPRNRRVQLSSRCAILDRVSPAEHHHVGRLTL